MRTVTITVTTVLLLLTSGCERDSAPPETPPAATVATVPSSAPRGPRLTFVSQTHDFGEIWDVEEQVHEFRFTNTGSKTLVIDIVKPSCGCTTTALDQKVFEPGEGDAIRIAFKPKGFGSQQKKITVTSNDAVEPMITLTIQALIRQFTRVEPNRIDFGDVVIGESAVRYVEVFSEDPYANIDSVGLRLNDGSFTATIVEEAPRPVPAGQPIARIGVTANPNMTWGAHYDSVIVNASGTLNNTPTTHEATTSITAKAYNNLVSDESMFRVAVVAPGSSFTRTVRFSNAQGSPFTLDARLVRANMPGMTVEVEPDGVPMRSAYLVHVQGDTGTFTGILNGLVEITTDLPGEERVTLNVQGMVRNPG